MLSHMPFKIVIAAQQRRGIYIITEKNNNNNKKRGRKRKQWHSDNLDNAFPMTVLWLSTSAKALLAGLVMLKE